MYTEKTGMKTKNSHKLYLVIFMWKRHLADYAWIAVGALIMAVGVNQFLVGVKLSTGGIGSVATMLFHFFRIPLSVTNLVLNIILFLLGYKIIGKHGLFKTIAGVLFLSLFLEGSALLPIYGDDILLCAVFGGLLCGIGVGTVIRSEGSTGGSDFVAVILHRLFPHIPVALVLMGIDFIIILISGIVFRSMTVMLYSLLALFVAAKTADMILTIGNAAKSVYILSEKRTEIANWVQSELGRGVTGIYSKGMYSNNDSTMLLCVVSPKELPQLVHTVRDMDKSAFVIITDVREVWGEGFRK